jgi:hypothetical protein
MRHRDRKTPVRPTRTARKPRHALKEGIATAVKQLNDAREDLAEVDAFVFVCIQALHARGRDDVDPVVATVLEAAYDKFGARSPSKTSGCPRGIGRQCRQMRAVMS